MKAKILILIFSLLSIYKPFAQNDESLKFEIFHVDLVPATFLYGGLELTWSQLMYRSLDATYAAQQEIDSLFKKLVILEEKTQDYQKNLQTLFTQTLNPQYIDRIVSEIKDIDVWIRQYAMLYPDYSHLSDDFRTKIADRAEKVKRYINDAAKKTGNTGRLDNRQRSDLNTYAMQELQQLKLVSIKLQQMMVAVNPPLHDFRLPNVGGR
jgi:hypothetical protein